MGVRSKEPCGRIEPEQLAGGGCMDFNQVRYFLMLAETLNFTRAAERCYVSQPALTQAIKRLEEELGGELIHRDGRETRLTPLGRALRSEFEQIDHTRHQIREKAKDLVSGRKQVLNLGVMCTVGPLVLADYFACFRKENPEVMLVIHDVSVRSLPELLLSGAIDVAICATHGPKHSRLSYTPLFREEMVVAFPSGHAFGETAGVALGAIAQQPYVDRLHCEFRDEFIRFCEDERIDLEVVVSSEREDWIQNMIRAGAGVSVIPHYSLLPPALDNRVVREPDLSREVELAVVAGREHLPAVTALLDFSRNHQWQHLT